MDIAFVAVLSPIVVVVAVVVVGVVLPEEEAEEVDEWAQCCDECPTLE